MNFTRNPMWNNVVIPAVTYAEAIANVMIINKCPAGGEATLKLAELMGSRQKAMSFR